MNTQPLTVVKKKSQHTVLPRKLKEKVDSLPLTNIQRGKAYKFLSLLIRKLCMEEDFSEYIALSQNYFRKVFHDSRYHDWLDILKEEIIETKKITLKSSEVVEYYIPDKIPKSYRIKEELLSDDWVHVTYRQKDSMEENTILLATKRVNKQIVYEDFDELYIEMTGNGQETSMER